MKGQFPSTAFRRNISIGIGFLLSPLLDEFNALISLIPPLLFTVALRKRHFRHTRVKTEFPRPQPLLVVPVQLPLL
jgi:hypothetical protein